MGGSFAPGPWPSLPPKFLCLLKAHLRHLARTAVGAGLGQIGRQLLRFRQRLPLFDEAAVHGRKGSLKFFDLGVLLCGLNVRR